MRFLFLLIFLIFFTVNEGIVLDNNQFLIYNKVYHRARLTLFQDGSIGTYEHGLHPDQLWTLKPHPSKKGCYYIVNEQYPQYRIADSRQRFVVYRGYHYPDQLFRFVPSRRYPGYYFIFNCYHTNDRIAKYGRGNDQVVMYSGRLYEDQLWKLVPRFEARIATKEVFHFDNRQGSRSIQRQISVTTGIKRLSSKTIRNKITYKQSIEASLSAAIKIFDVGVKSSMEFSTELETTFMESMETNWSKTERINFTIPAFKNFKVMQQVVIFDGKFSYDSCSLLLKIKIFESDTSDFVGDDGLF